ncbi:unnamed protein product [Gongylonema pulchrum]|uniref:DM10 domain-containing protein n=1 Tax=Gongylonema pulchrum TaxID=637853 RepID=A0A183D593_9BILA|nr:unnamed protein product [Gongylonema pulchrum]
MKFLLTYHVDKQLLDIAEAGKGREWYPGRAFLEGVDSSNYGVDQYKINAVLKVYRWKFRLLEADDATQQYLRSKETQQK